MSKDFVTFLLQCSRQLEITKVFWYRPEFLISPYQKSFADLFALNDREKVRRTMQQASSRHDNILCLENFSIISPKVDVSLCIMPMGENFLVFGQNAPVTGTDCTDSAQRDTIHLFMKLVKAADSELITENERMIREQFEQIQKLNNDLLNMQRQLRKANTRLNQLNEDLNNRLVKDALTGLISRYQYRQEIELAIAREPGKLGIFTFIDLDDFKSVNDNYGHRTGDEFLRGFASRLMTLPFSNLICMRIAGDEFGLYIHGYDAVDMQHSQQIWDAIRDKVLNQPIPTDQAEIQPVCSAGMAIYGKDTTEIYDLIEYADFAMYEAKRAGKNTYRVFDKMKYLDSRI